MAEAPAPLRALLTLPMPIEAPTISPAAPEATALFAPIAPKPTLPAKPAGKQTAKSSQLAIGYHDDQQKVWNGNSWSVSWKPGGCNHTDAAVAIFADGSEFICSDILQGELQEKGVFKRDAPKKVAKDKSKDGQADTKYIGTHPNADIGNLTVTPRKDCYKEQFACLLDGKKKQLCQVSSKNAPLEHGLDIMTKLAQYMLNDPSITEKGI